MAVASGSSRGRRRGRQRRLLVVVLASIVVNAVLGVYALAVPHFGELQAKVLATSACVTGAGVLAFACLPALERRRLHLVPQAGIVASVIGFGLLVIGAWAQPESPSFWQTAGTLLIVAAAAAFVSVLSLAELALRYRPVFLATALLAALFAAMLVRVVWSEGASEAYGRVLGVVGVLLAATTVSVPILHRASRSEARAEARSGSEVLFCPACGRRLGAAATAGTRCAACGAVFHVSFTSRPGRGARRREGPTREGARDRRLAGRTARRPGTSRTR